MGRKKRKNVKLLRLNAHQLQPWNCILVLNSVSQSSYKNTLSQTAILHSKVQTVTEYLNTSLHALVSSKPRPLDLVYVGAIYYREQCPFELCLSVILLINGYHGKSDPKASNRRTWIYRVGGKEENMKLGHLKTLAEVFHPHPFT